MKRKPKTKSTAKARTATPAAPKRGTIDFTAGTPPAWPDPVGDLVALCARNRKLGGAVLAGAPLDTALKVVNQGPAPANEDGATSAENAGASRTRQRRTTRKPGRPKGPRPYKTQPDVVAALNGATLISPDGKKTSLHVSLRKVQAMEADPANVPDELRGYCAAVRKTQASWDAWHMSLGQKDGIHKLMSRGAAIQSGLHPR